MISPAQRFQQNDPSPGELHLATRTDAFVENLLLGAVGGATFAGSLIALRRLAPGPLGWIAFVLIWLLAAYIFLPRLQRILTAVYIPSYFLGRTRTGEGLLGDPVNLAFRGSEEQLHTGFTNAGWTLADPINTRSALRVVRSFFLKDPYPAAPVSDLILFDRVEDFAYEQQLGANGSRRHHVRFWRCPPGWPLPGGERVDWLAAGSFDRRVGVSLYTLHVTHKIEREIDRERDHILETLRLGEPHTEVQVLHDFTTGYHDRNGGGDAVQTDGSLPIVDLRGIPDDGLVETPRRLAASRDFDPGRRPLPLLVGSLLGGASAALLTVFALTLLSTRDIMRASGLPSSVAHGWLLFFQFGVGIAIVAGAILSLFTYVGSQLARWGLLLLLALGIGMLMTYAIVAVRLGWFIGLTTTLLLCALHTLTNRTVRDWTTKNRQPRA